MADNYLEKKMEEYRSGRMGHGSSSGGAKVSVRFEACFDGIAFAGKRVLVTGECVTDGVGRETLRLYRALGCRVAFCSTDMKEGARLAQEAGCRHYPMDWSVSGVAEKVRADMIRHWGGIDIEVSV